MPISPPGSTRATERPGAQPHDRDHCTPPSEVVRIEEARRRPPRFGVKPLIHGERTVDRRSPRQRPDESAEQSGTDSSCQRAHGEARRELERHEHGRVSVGRSRDTDREQQREPIEALAHKDHVPIDVAQMLFRVEVKNAESEY